MTNTAYIGNFDRLEVSFTPAGGERKVLATNTLTGPTWNLDVKQLHELDLKTIQGLGYMLLKMACTKLPLDPDHQAGVAAIAAYQAAQRSSAVVNNATTAPSLRVGVDRGVWGERRDPTDPTVSKPPDPSELDRLKHRVDCVAFTLVEGPTLIPIKVRPGEAMMSRGFKVQMGHHLGDTTPTLALGVLEALSFLVGRLTSGTLSDPQNVEIILPVKTYDHLNAQPVASAGSDSVLDYFLKSNPGVRVRGLKNAARVRYKNPDDPKGQDLCFVDLLGI
jgi:hypothetical protein